LAQTSAQIATALIFGDGQSFNRAQNNFLDAFLATLRTTDEEEEEDDDEDL
jgi:hypothetical protein